MTTYNHTLKRRYKNEDAAQTSQIIHEAYDEAIEETQG